MTGVSDWMRHCAVTHLIAMMLLVSWRSGTAQCRGHEMPTLRPRHHEVAEQMIQMDRSRGMPSPRCLRKGCWRLGGDGGEVFL